MRIQGSDTSREKMNIMRVMLSSFSQIEYKKLILRNPTSKERN